MEQKESEAAAEAAAAAASAVDDDMSKIDHQFLNGGAKSKSQDNFLNKKENSDKKQKQKGNSSEKNAKIADVFELPPTVVNNVLYQNIK
jgi:hypothetical protein